MQERNLSCPVLSPVNVDCNVNHINRVEKVLLTKDGKEVPQDFINKMQDYARELRRKFPHMKPKRVERKVAEHFKIKIV